MSGSNWPWWTELFISTRVLYKLRCSHHLRSSTSAPPRCTLLHSQEHVFFMLEISDVIPPKSPCPLQTLHPLPLLITLACSHWAVSLTEAFPGVLIKITAPGPRSGCSLFPHSTSQSNKAGLLDLSLYRHFALSPTRPALRQPITLPCPVHCPREAVLQEVMETDSAATAFRSKSQPCYLAPV